MTTQTEKVKQCDYFRCTKEGVFFDIELEAWLCEEHKDSVTASTGYCSEGCMLGYGCDGSC